MKQEKVKKAKGIYSCMNNYMNFHQIYNYNISWKGVMLFSTLNVDFNGFFCD